MPPQLNERGTSNRGTGREVRSDAPRSPLTAVHEPAVDPALDARMATLAEISSVTTAIHVGQLTCDEIGAILLHVQRAAQRFDAAPGPLTQQVVAADLLEVYRVLRDRERVAPRCKKGELLKEVRSIEGKATLIPWLPSRPTRVDEIVLADSPRPLFGLQNMQRWLGAVSYRIVASPPPAGSRRGSRPPQRPSQPVDSTGVHAYNLTLVSGKGKAVVRRTLPWPLGPLIVPNAYKIDLVKGEGMSFLSRPGRTKILEFLLEVVAERSEDGLVYCEESGEYIPAEDLAKRIVETAEVGVGRIMFEGPESAFKSFEHAQIGHRTDFTITDQLIEILWYYTKIESQFRRHERKEAKKGCASIEWITELMREVPHKYKQLWMQDRLMQDHVVYPDNLKPGMLVPAGYFLTEKVAESLGGEDHQVLFITSFTANDRVILTEDGRLWLIKERERNLQAFCEAVIQLQGILTLSFILCSAIGAVLGGPLVGFLMTAGDVAIDINQAGGIRNFLKELKNNPLKAGWFMLDLVTSVADIKGMKNLLMNPTESLEASMRLANDAAQARRALPGDAGSPVNTATEKSSRAADGATAAKNDAQMAKPAAPAPAQTPLAHSTDAKANTRPPDRPATGQPLMDTRSATRPTEPPRAPQETPPKAKGEPDVEVTVTEQVDDAAKAAKAADAAETVGGTGRRRVPSRDRRRGPMGTVKDVRYRRPPKPKKNARGGTRRNPPGTRPIRGGGRVKKAVAKAKDPLQTFLGKGKRAREAAEKLERLDAGDLLREIAREWARHAVDGRKLLVRIAKMTDDEIKGLAAVRRALIREPVIRSARPRRLPGESAAILRGATSELGWMDVLHLPSGARSDLLKLMGKLEPVVDTGLARALGRALETGAFSIQGGLGHFHAAAYLADFYKSQGIRMTMEEAVRVSNLGLREIDIRATIGGVLHMDIEIKTYLGQLVMYDSVRGQVVKDLVRHIDDGFEGMRYLFSPNVRNELQVFRNGILEAFDSPAVQAAIRGKGLDPARIREVLVRRLDDTGHPMVDVYQFL